MLRHLSARRRLTSRVMACQVLGALSLTVAACATTRTDIEPRYVSLHNAFVALGLAQTGPIHGGSLAQGREQRLTLQLPAHCTTLVALGGQHARDVDLTLLDPRGAPIAHDTTHEPQAVVRACVQEPGTYTLVVKMAAGWGNFVASSWAGGVGGASGAPAGATPGLAVAAGTCESPIPLARGTTSGNTSRGEANHEGSCATSNSSELVYRLEVPSRQRVEIDVDPRFDAVLFIRRGDCASEDAEVACNDDAPQGRASRLDEVLEAGTYFVFVDGYQNEAGNFKMTVAMQDVPALAEVCRQARPLTLGGQVTGNTERSFDHAQATCGEGAKGPDSIYRLEVPQRSRVRVTMHSDELTPVVFLRRACTDPQSELACGDTSTADNEAVVTAMLDPGAYAVVADATDRAAAGSFRLGAELGPEQGAGTSGDGCSDALPLPRGDTTIRGDTFSARDDVAGSCGGSGAPDLVYRVDVTRRSRLTARVTASEAKHTLVLTRSCGERAAEVACGADLDQQLVPGTYFLAVDGAAKDHFGRFDVEYRLRDAAAQGGACQSAPALPLGTTQGTTAGAGDKFLASCADKDDRQGGGDRVYRLVLAARRGVRVVLKPTGWNGLVSLRRSCVDPATRGSQNEVECSQAAADGAGGRSGRINAVLDPGTYYVIVDSEAGGGGPFTLEYSQYGAP